MEINNENELNFQLAKLIYDELKQRGLISFSEWYDAIISTRKALNLPICE